MNVKQINIRNTILDRLVEMDKTRNWLSCQPGISVTPATVRNFLYGNKDTTSGVIGELFVILGLDITNIGQENQSND
jgi:hypothetical protein